MKKNNDETKELVETHWNSYVKPLLEIHGEDPEIIEKCGFHYLTSGVHFYKHAISDLTNRGENENE